MLKNETERIRNKNWEELLNKTAAKYKEPKEFWEVIKKLKESKTPSAQHLKTDNRKIFKEEEQEEIHR